MPAARSRPATRRPWTSALRRTGRKATCLARSISPTAIPRRPRSRSRRARGCSSSPTTASWLRRPPAAWRKRATTRRPWTVGWATGSPRATRSSPPPTRTRTPSSACSRASAQPELPDRLLGRRLGMETVGEAVANLDRVDEPHRGLDPLPADPFEPDQDGDPVGPFGDALRDHLDLTPGLVEAFPPAADALLARVDRLQPREDPAGVVLDLVMTDREESLEIVRIPGGVAALGQLGLGGLRGHERELSRSPGSVVLRPPAVERPDRQQDRADRDAEDRR